MLKALCDYYDCLQKQPDSDITPEGYSNVGINYNLVLTENGSIKDILPYTHTIISGKKEKSVATSELFPFRNSTTAITAETIDHREKYIFGIEFGKGDKILKVNKAAFDKCREVNEKFLRGLEHPLVRAYLLFMEKWIPENELENAFILRMGKDYSGAKFVITLDGEEDAPLNRLLCITDKWNAQLSTNNIPEDAVIGQCAITGERLPIARKHNGISKIPGGQSSGVRVVCFKDSAFESYGKSQSYNSSISINAMKKYTAALNHLTNAQDETTNNPHRRILDDTILYYWAQTNSSEKPYTSVFNACTFGEDDADEILQAVFKAVSAGKAPDIKGVNLDTDFYILGVKPNSSRLSVKFFERNSFGKILNNLVKHKKDMSFSDKDKQLPVWLIIKSLKSPVADTQISPDLQVKLLKSILNGTPYPKYLLESVVRRVRTDHDIPDKKFYSVNETRCRIIKGSLLRNNIINEGEYNMLNEASKNVAYNLGRLFAVLEKVQTSAMGSVNASIKDRYFSSASATPSIVFPKLLQLSQHHLANLKSNQLDKQIQAIVAKLEDSFPKTLNTEQQGTFIIGYYQQKQKLYEGKNAVEQVNSKNSEEEN